MLLLGFGSMVIGLLRVPILLKIPIAIAVVLAVIPFTIYQKTEFRKVLIAAAIIAVAGSVAFDVVLMLPLNFVGPLLAFIIYWVIVSAVLDHYFDVYYDQSYAVTAEIVVPTVLIWMIAGFVMLLLQHTVVR